MTRQHDDDRWPAPVSPANAILIYTDMQAGALSTVGSMDPQELKRNAIALAQAASLLQLPVILAGAAIPGEAGVVMPELPQILPQHSLIRHATNNSWETPEFAQAVRASGRTHLIMAGIATDVGLGLTAISAVRAGYTVYALVDVSGTFNARIEQAAWLRLMQAGVILTSWTALIGEIQHDYTQGHGPQLRALIGEALRSSGGPFGT